jgi:cytochrome c-type biogenesis protein CcmE
MKSGPIVTAIVATLAMAGVVTAFMTNASPYVTIAQAKNSHSNRLHLAGDLDKKSVHADPVNRTLTFRLKDENGETVTVLHKGDPPANMGEATKVVAIGKMEGDKFVSDDLLVKCPSKYETDPKT